MTKNQQFNQNKVLSSPSKRQQPVEKRQ